MSASKSPLPPVFEEIDGPILVDLLNQAVESFDVEELSLEAALLLYVLLDRAMTALWRQYPRELMVVITQKLATLETNDDEESGGSDDDGDDA